MIFMTWININRISYSRKGPEQNTLWLEDRA